MTKPKRLAEVAPINAKTYFIPGINNANNTTQINAINVIIISVYLENENPSSWLSLSPPNSSF